MRRAACRLTSVLALALTGALPLALTGCNVMGAILYYLSPRHIQKPEFEFPPGASVALLIEPARPEAENPVFIRALHENTERMLRDGGCEAKLAPVEETNRVRKSAARDWSLQRIGRDLGADYVIYVRIVRLQIRELSDHPMISPYVELDMKLIGVDRPAAFPRIWPDGREGHAVTCKRQTSEASDPDAEDAETARLGHDTAYYVSMPFIEVDLEERPPVAR